MRKKDPCVTSFVLIDRDGNRWSIIVAWTAVTTGTHCPQHTLAMLFIVLWPRCITKWFDCDLSRWSVLSLLCTEICYIKHFYVSAFVSGNDPFYCCTANQMSFLFLFLSSFPLPPLSLVFCTDTYSMKTTWFIFLHHGLQDSICLCFLVGLHPYPYFKCIYFLYLM